MPRLETVHPSYRPDIDGLRAFAVLSIVGYHAFPGAFPGGFVGVDIFFVISGFLISTIIFKGMAAGQFSFLDFYARRIKRIFPALIVVLAATLVFGWLRLLPDEFADLGKNAAASAAFLVNLRLAYDAGYFATAAELKPLLHLWSLSVEEQFYLGWPLLAVLAWKIRAALGVLLIVLVSSFALNILAVGSKPIVTFYLPMTRVWELLAGGLVAYATLGYAPWLTRGLEALQRQLRGAFAFVPALLLLAGVFGLDPSVTFPGWWALIPTVAAVLFIAAGPEALPNRTLFSHPAAVFVGLISYPLYLWHWPLLTFPRILDSASLPTRVGAVVLSVLLATATYRFLEQPIRRASNRASIPLLGLLAITGLAGYAIDKGMIAPQSDSVIIRSITEASNDWWSFPPSVTSVAFQGQTFWQDGSGAAKVVYFGDSNMEQFFPRVHELVRQNRDKSAIYAYFGGCPPIPQVTDASRRKCLGFTDAGFAYAKRADVATVVLGAQWHGYLTGEGFYFVERGRADLLQAESAGQAKAYAALERELADLQRLGKRVYLILNIPVGPQLGPRSRLARSIVAAPVVTDSQALPLETMMVGYAPVRDRLIQIARSTGAAIIDPLPFLCAERACPSALPDGTPMYKDSAHLRASFVREKVRFIDRTMR